MASAFCGFLFFLLGPIPKTRHPNDPDRLVFGGTGRIANGCRQGLSCFEGTPFFARFKGTPFWGGSLPKNDTRKLRCPIIRSLQIHLRKGITHHAMEMERPQTKEPPLNGLNTFPSSQLLNSQKVVNSRKKQGVCLMVIAFEGFPGTTETWR